MDIRDHLLPNHQHLRQPFHMLRRTGTPRPCSQACSGRSMKAKLSQRLLQVSLPPTHSPCVQPRSFLPGGCGSISPSNSASAFSGTPYRQLPSRPHSHKQAGVRAPLVRGPITPVPLASSHYPERLQSPDPDKSFFRAELHFAGRLVTSIINHGFALCSPLGCLAVQELSEKFLLEKLPVTCRLVPFLRAKPGHTHPWLQHIAYINAIVQTRGPRSALRNSAAPVPVNDVLGPRFLYRDFTDCAQHVKSHPGPVRLNYLRLAVRGPLRVNAPLHIGFKKFLNSAPSLWRGVGRNHVRGRRLTSTATGLPEFKLWLHHAASRADRKARLKVNGNSADAFASYLAKKTST